MNHYTTFYCQFISESASRQQELAILEMRAQNVYF